MIIKTMKTHPEPSRVQSDNTQVEELYNFGGELVYISDGKIHRITPATLKMYPALSGFYKGEGGYEPNCSGVIATRGFNRRHLEKIDCWDVPVLRGVIDVPALRPDGSLLDRPGYDDATGLFFCGNSSDLVEVPDDPTMDEVQEAVQALWRPFKDSEFCTDVDRAAYLEAVLTAVQHPVLQRAPAVAYKSSVDTKWKDFLERSAGCLASETAPGEMTASPDFSEMKRHLFDLLREDRKVVFFDSDSDPFDSIDLSAFLKSEKFYGRTLGKNVKLKVPQGGQVIVAGCNPEFRGDLSRRVFACRLDPRTEDTRNFNSDPAQYVQDNRQKLVAAVLTILRGYLRYNTEKSPDALLWCDDWTLIRGAVRWIGAEGLLDVGDPEQSIQPTSAHDD